MNHQTHVNTIDDITRLQDRMDSKNSSAAAAEDNAGIAKTAKLKAQKASAERLVIVGLLW